MVIQEQNNSQEWLILALRTNLMNVRIYLYIMLKRFYKILSVRFRILPMHPDHKLLPSSAQLKPTPTSVGWAEIALISTFTHPPPPPPHPQGKYRAQLSPAQSNSNSVGWAYRKLAQS